MSRPIGLDFENALKTSATLKPHCLYDMDHRGTLKLCNCAAWYDALVLIGSWKHFKHNAHLEVSDYLDMRRFSYVHLSRVYV